MLHVIGGQNKYIKIFDAIDKQKVYDEKELIRKLKGPGSQNNFAVAKNYLFKFILKTLEAYNTNVKSELRSMLNQIEILYNKNLPQIAKKMIGKAKAMAQEHELYELMEEITDWEIIFLVEDGTPENYLAQVDKYYEELYDSIEKKKAIIGYKYLHQKLRAKMLNTGLVRDDKEMMEFQDIMNEDKSSDQNLANTFNAQFYRNLMQSNYFFMINDQLNAHKILKKNMMLLDQNHHMVELRPFICLALLRNKGINELALMLYPDLFETLKKMDQFIEKYGYLNRNYELLSETLKLFVYVNIGYFDRALEVAKNIEAIYTQLPVTRTSIKERQLHHYALSYIYLGLKEYRLASQNINLLLHSIELDYRSDVYYFAHIMSMIIYYEMNDTDMLEKRIRSTYRLLLRRKKLYNFEKLVITFFRESQERVKSPDQLVEKFVLLRDNIRELTTTSNIEKNALGLFDLISWLESKIENKNFMEIVQRKFHERMLAETAKTASEQN